MGLGYVLGFWLVCMVHIPGTLLVLRALLLWVPLPLKKALHRGHLPLSLLLQLSWTNSDWGCHARFALESRGPGDTLILFLHM